MEVHDSKDPGFLKYILFIFLKEPSVNKDSICIEQREDMITRAVGEGEFGSDV